MELLRNSDKENICNVDAKWVLEENRFFSQCPNFLIELEVKNISSKSKWLELTKYVIEDLKWLLKLENDKFWSFMIYSKEARELIFSVLTECSPSYVRHSSLLSEEVLHVFQKIEKLLFLIFVRLSTVNESEVQKLNNLGKILYDNYLFTVPVILDICLIYGPNNPELVAKMINKVIALSPNFLKDFQEMVPHFFKGLRLVKDATSIMNHSMSGESKDLHCMKMQSLLYFLHDSAATIEIFLKLYSNACCIFCSNEAMQEIITFYSNALSQIQIIYKNNRDQMAFLNFQDLFEKIRLDILKIVKSILDFKARECRSAKINKEEAVDEYLNMVQELVAEPNFLSDYNTLFSLKAEIEAISKIHNNVDFIKVNHILQGISLSKSYSEGNTNNVVRNSKRDLESFQNIDQIKFNSLVTEVKDIFPSLDEAYIETLLKCHNCNVEKIISIILDGSSTNNDLNFKSSPLVNKSNSKKILKSFIHPEASASNDAKEQLDDKASWRGNAIEYTESANEIYDDEYDDSYDGNQDLTLKDVNETDPEIRPFVIPRVLRKPQERRHFFEENEESGEEEENKDEKGNVLEFLRNPEELRENDKRKNQRRTNQGERYEGQRKNVQRARNFKEAHKSFIGNHNRKNQASRKRNF